MHPIPTLLWVSLVMGIAPTSPVGAERGLTNSNPAAVYCETLGYTYRIDTDVLGAQTGVCVFPDATECDAWLFLEGYCGVAHSYCATQGWDLIVKTDGLNPFTLDYAVCTLGGVEQGAVTDLLNLIEGELVVPPGPAPAAPPGGVGARFSAPASFDWRNNGGDWMSPVKDQARCGSCWAFSAVGAVEALFNIEQNDPDYDVNLAEQHLVGNPSPCYSQYDCDGGWHYDALDYIRDSGVVDESCLSYQASDTGCSMCGDWQNRLTHIDRREPITNNPALIKQAIVNHGPVSVALRMSGTWDGNDVYRCDPDGGVNHAVVVAGYDDAGGYWIVKNSWGANWHDHGYFKVGYGECSIQNYVHSPQMNHPANCNDVILEDYIMSNNLVDCPGHGLVIGADNITLDCAGHAIDGDNLRNANAGVLVDGRTGVTIKNCDIHQFNWGIRLASGADNAVIRDNTTNDNNVGISTSASTSADVLSNTSNSNASYGISIDGGSGHAVTNNTVEFNNDGASILNTSLNTVSNNTIRDNDNHGMILNGTNSSDITGNVIRGNTGDGLQLSSSTDNDIWDNDFSDNTANNAYEDSNSNGNRWDDGNHTGNYWDDHVPGHLYWPIWYDISGGGDGIDHWPDTRSWLSVSFPGDGLIHVILDAILEWLVPPELGGTATYDVYFGQLGTLDLVSSNQTSTSYDPGPLQYGTTYNWQIIVHYNGQTLTPGPVWTFTTMQNPANIPTVSGWGIIVTGLLILVAGAVALRSRAQDTEQVKAA